MWYTTAQKCIPLKQKMREAPPLSDNAIENTTEDRLVANKISSSYDILNVEHIASPCYYLQAVVYRWNYYPDSYTCLARLLQLSVTFIHSSHSPLCGDSCWKGTPYDSSNKPRRGVALPTIYTGYDTPPS